MILNEELLAVQRGEQGEAMRKVLNTLVMYGEAFGAERMVKITGRMGHSVIGTGSMTWKPVFDLMEELIDGGALPRQSFTTDPRGVEDHVPMSLKDRAMFKVIFSGQKRMEQEWERMGIKDSNAYTCTAYMKEVGNIPRYGDILGWAESSAVLQPQFGHSGNDVQYPGLCAGVRPSHGRGKKSGLDHRCAVSKYA